MDACRLHDDEVLIGLKASHIRIDRIDLIVDALATTACLIKKVEPLLGDVAADIVLGYHVHASSCGAGSAWNSPVQLFRLMVHRWEGTGPCHGLSERTTRIHSVSFPLQPYTRTNTQDSRVCAASLRSLLRPRMTKCLFRRQDTLSRRTQPRPLSRVSPATSPTSAHPRSRRGRRPA